MKFGIFVFCIFVCILANIAGSLDPDYHGVTLRLWYSRVGAVKKATEEGDNLLSRKEVTIATKP